MKPLIVRGIFLLLVAAFCSSSAAAQDRDSVESKLTTEREKISYMIGMDVAHSIAPISPDIDLSAFERSVRHTLEGGQPLLSEEETKATGQLMMQHIAAHKGEQVQGLPPGSPPPALAKDRVGLLIGADVGRSLAPIETEIELPIFFRAVTTLLANGTPLLPQAETDTLRTAFSQRMQAGLQKQKSELAEKNQTEGEAFLAQNKPAKGVFSTPSGLQYMVLRQGTGPRPNPMDRVRVNYHGTLLDGTVFDSTYDRGQPAEFGLGDVIAGWSEGLPLMPVGAKYRFWIPAALAYGANGTPGGVVGPNATLVFDVELLGIL